ncbi:MAG: MoaD/ThiS family protein [Planctomycetaceae bacterium]
MSVAVEVPVVLRSCSGGASQLSIAASSIRDVLDQIERLHPLLYRSVCDDSGAVRRHVNVFVNSSLMQKPAVLETPLASGDIVTIFQAVSGG